MSFPSDGYNVTSLLVQVRAVMDDTDEMESVSFVMTQPAGTVLEDVVDDVIQIVTNALSAKWVGEQYSFRSLKTYTGGLSVGESVIPA